MFHTDQIKKGKILITDGGYKHTLGAVRFLAKEGYKIDAIGPSRSLSAWSRYLSCISYEQDDFCEEGFEKFLNFLSKEEYDVILPIGAKSVKLVARHKNEVKKYCRVPIADYDKISLCLEKSQTYSLAQKLGVNVPKTWVFSSKEALKDSLQEIVFPVIVKGNSEIIKDKPMYALNRRELLEILKVWGSNISLSNDAFPIIQQYIKGASCGFFALYKDGVCKRIFMHKRIRQTPTSGGASCCALSIYERDLFENGKKLLDALNWHGVAMVEFKRQFNTGKLYLMEINPKFWGSLDLALTSGINFPALAVQMALGQNLEYSEDYCVGLKFHWPLNGGELHHVLDNPKAFFSVLIDCLNPKTKSNLWIRDPMPAIYSLYAEVRYILAQLVRRIIKFLDQ